MNLPGRPARLVIVGAGGNGREVARIASDALADGHRGWVMGGMIDDNPAALDNSRCKWPLLGRVSDWEPADDEVFVVAVGSPQVRANLVDTLSERGARFGSVIHPSALIDPSASIGSGVVIYPFANVSTDVVIGDHVQLNAYDNVGHDARIGMCSVLSCFCDVTGFVSIGQRVLLGSHVSIAPGLSVGDDAVLGLGSVVVAPVRAGRHVFGNPAKTMRS